MSSFLSILTSIGKTVLGIEQVAAPIAETIFPAAAPIISALDKIFQNLQGAVVTAEVNNPTGNGQVKSDAVIADFQAGLALTQSVLALEHKELQYDAAALQTAISAQVGAFNAMAAVKASFHIADLPK